MIVYNTQILGIDSNKTDLQDDTINIRLSLNMEASYCGYASLVFPKKENREKQNHEVKYHQHLQT